ncbi:putative voltage-dependent calcium channel subunit alpha-2/delta-1-like isoform X1 [Apostichopus japonicus]|uniref:Putative voltage-dependent calcium channel subunit alpha-2/delta-1-like isoform X1 n=1 Tax=Stichopus japonicus TaxID=307972 RepID=A0A2G8KB54_STIJA|nr:putative voltage-dependent calcium channel subunit alpha-2/delta-1-like isoform X1 [Apostichopus japonicus]
MIPLKFTKQSMIQMSIPVGNKKHLCGYSGRLVQHGVLGHEISDSKRLADMSGGINVCVTDILLSRSWACSCCFYIHLISSLDTEEAQRAKQDPWEQNYYRRPLYKPDTYIFSVPYNDGQGLNNESVLDITASKAIHINRKWSPAVVGAILNAQTFEEFWLPKTMQGENGLDGAYCFQNTSAQHCYLLDDGGFIISTSAEDVKSDVSIL